MSEWSARKSFLVIVLAGVAPICVACIEIPFDDPRNAGVFVFMGTPTGLFLLSLVISLWSEELPRRVAISAGFVGVLFIIGLLINLGDRGAGGGTGGPGGAAIFMAGAMLLGVVVSAVVLIIVLVESCKLEVKPPAATPGDTSTTSGAAPKKNRRRSE